MRPNDLEAEIEQEQAAGDSAAYLDIASLDSVEALIAFFGDPLPWWQTEKGLDDAERVCGYNLSCL